MKIKDLKKKAYYKISIGIILLIPFGFLTLLSFLKSIYFISKQDKLFGDFFSNLVLIVIDFLFSKTSFIPLLWTSIWEKLPIFNPSQILQKENYYFLTLLGVVLYSILLIQDGFWLKNYIKNIESEVEKERLKNEIKKQKGLIETSQKDLIGIEIIVADRDPWYKRPLGIIILSLVTVILGRIILLILHID